MKLVGATYTVAATLLLVSCETPLRSAHATVPACGIVKNGIPGGYLNLRESPNGKIIKRLKPGTEVWDAQSPITMGEWFQTAYEDSNGKIKYGWVASRYIRFSPCDDEPALAEGRLIEEPQAIEKTGLEKNEYIRYAPSGQRIEIGWLYSLRADCSVMPGIIDVTITTRPEHGAIKVIKNTGFPNYDKGDGRWIKCNKKKILGVSVYYTAAKGYIGPDMVDYRVIYPDGTAYEEHYAINIR